MYRHRHYASDLSIRPVSFTAVSQGSGHDRTHTAAATVPVSEPLVWGTDYDLHSPYLGRTFFTMEQQTRTTYKQQAARLSRMLEEAERQRNTLEAQAQLQSRRIRLIQHQLKQEQEKCKGLEKLVQESNRELDWIKLKGIMSDSIYNPANSSSTLVSDSGPDAVPELVFDDDVETDSNSDYEAQSPRMNPTTKIKAKAGALSSSYSKPSSQGFSKSSFSSSSKNTSNFDSNPSNFRNESKNAPTSTIKQIVRATTITQRYYRDRRNFQSFQQLTRVASDLKRIKQVKPDIFSINGNTKPIFEYENWLTKLLAKLDQVPSYHNNNVRVVRKHIVKAINSELEHVDILKDQVNKSVLPSPSFHSAASTVGKIGIQDPSTTSPDSSFASIKGKQASFSDISLNSKLYNPSGTSTPSSRSTSGSTKTTIQEVPDEEFMNL